MADREWTADCVADHFEEAFRTLRKLPPVKAKGYFNVWPEVARTRREIAAKEPQTMRVWPSADAITRLDLQHDRAIPKAGWGECAGRLALPFALTGAFWPPVSSEGPTGLHPGGSFRFLPGNIRMLTDECSERRGNRGAGT